ncbi:MAG TPA: hypothetical protein VGD45_00065 [Steroidobacter sp.]|uniref:hypothetical protein n=1 Tax=Steroidobacter sp. TaxID=1978227 RepID=UPI002EDAB6AB
MSQSGEEKVASTPSGSDRKSGRAVFDQGRTVWEWQTATGVFERHVSDEQLARLENAGLQLVDQPAPNAGRAIYSSDPVARTARKQVVLSRPTSRVRVTPVEPVGVLRQFWRRLVPST